MVPLILSNAEIDNSMFLQICNQEKNPTLGNSVQIPYNSSVLFLCKFQNQLQVHHMHKC